MTTPLGKLADQHAQRDAIHIAILPAIAADELSPGQAVAYDHNTGAANHPSTPTSKGIGIADPFYPRTILPGERFYICLYPDTVTGMRHHWEHPAIPSDFPTTAKQASDKSYSEQWLRNFAVKIKPYFVSRYDWTTKQDNAIPGGEDRAYKALLDDLRDNYLRGEGTEVDLDDFELAEVCQHAQAIGIIVRPGNITFSCGC